MRQYILPPSWDGGPRLELAGAQAKRLVSVLRLKPGSEFPALDARGGSRLCRLLEAGPGRALLEVGPARSQNASEPLPDIRGGATDKPACPLPDSVSAIPKLPRIVLAPAMLKGTKLDEVARAAAEAGVSEIVPLYSERSVPRGDGAGRVERLRRIVAEALGQSGSAVATAVREPMPLADFVAAQSDEPGLLRLYFHESPLAQTALHGYCSSGPERVVACVGPEGGFSPGELSLFDAAGFRPAWMGPGVFRAETAAVFAVASIRIVCLERSSWSMKK